MAHDALHVLIGRLGQLSSWPGLKEIRNYCRMALQREAEARAVTDPEFLERIRRLVLVWLVLDVHVNSWLFALGWSFPPSQIWDLVGESSRDWHDAGITDPLFAMLIRRWGYAPTDLMRAGLSRDSLRLYLTGDKPPRHLRAILAAGEKSKKSDK